MIQFVRIEFEGPVARVADRVAAAIDETRAHGSSPLWGEAVRAALAIHRAPQHFLRSQLVLLGHLAGGGPPGGEAIERFAAGMELLHLFMLVHDDVMDEASMRRGRPTIHLALHQADPALGAAQTRDLAIVIGNTLSVLAMRHLLCGGRGSAACEVVLDACLRTGIGQFEDVTGWHGLDVGGRETFRSVLVDKAAYQAFAAPFAGGLLLADPEADPGPAIAWGCRMGVAFQGLDDLADLVGDPGVTGKDNFRDLLEGRRSLALAMLLQRASGDERVFLSGVVGRQALDPADRVELGRLLHAHAVISGCADFIRDEIAEAERLASGCGFGAEVQEGMAAIAGGLRASLAELLAAAEEEATDDPWMT